MSNSLVEIPSTQWPELRELFIEERNTSTAYNTLKCFIDWKAQNKDVDIKILTLDDGEWRKDGSHICVVSNYLVFVFVNTLSEKEQRLLNGMNALKLNNFYMVIGFPEHLTSTAEQHWVDMGFKRENFHPGGVVYHHIEKENVEKFLIDIPAGLSLRPLELKHAELVDSLWPLHAPGTVGYIELLITYNDSVGVFDSEDNLVAWCLILPMGTLGVLHVLDTHKRKGLGSLAVRYLSKKIAAKGLEVTAPVVFSNEPSLGLFRKLGFKITSHANFVVIPTKNQ